MKEVRIVCAASAGPFPYFVEVEDAQGRSFEAGVWRVRPDGMRELVLDLRRLSDLVLAEPAADGDVRPDGAEPVLPDIVPGQEGWREP